MEKTASYWKKVNAHLKEFIDQYVDDKEKLLGVAVALQLPIQDDRAVWLKNMPENKRLDLQKVRACFDMPVKFYNSAKVATFAQIWALNNRGNFQFLSIGGYISGAIVYDGQVLEYTDRHGEYGNMLVPHAGEPMRFTDVCTYQAIMDKTGMDLAAFFDQVRKQDKQCLKIWEEYLDVLSCCLYNMHCAFNWDIVIGGAMSEYIEEYEADIKRRLTDMENYVECKEADYIKVSDLGVLGAAIGAAMTLIDAYLNDI